MEKTNSLFNLISHQQDHYETIIFLLKIHMNCKYQLSIIKYQLSNIYYEPTNAKVQA